MVVEFSSLCHTDIRAYLAYVFARDPNVRNLFERRGVLVDDIDHRTRGTPVNTAVPFLVHAPLVNGGEDSSSNVERGGCGGRSGDVVDSHSTVRFDTVVGSNDRRGVGVDVRGCGDGKGSSPRKPVAGFGSGHAKDAVGGGKPDGRPDNVGPNWERNLVTRAKNKARRARRGQVAEEGASSRSSFFYGCAPSVVSSLKDTRARRLIQENERAIEKAQADVERLRRERESGVVEKRVNIQNTFLDGQISGKFALNAPRARGWAETVCSGSGQSSSPGNPDGTKSLNTSGNSLRTSEVPSLSSGSVSPNSSISVEESVKLIRRNERLEKQVKELSVKPGGNQLVKAQGKIRDLETQLSFLKKPFQTTYSPYESY